MVVCRYTRNEWWFESLIFDTVGITTVRYWRHAIPVRISQSVSPFSIFVFTITLFVARLAIAYCGIARSFWNGALCSHAARSWRLGPSKTAAPTASLWPWPSNLRQGHDQLRTSVLNTCIIGWQWRDFVPYLCQLVFAAILWVKLLHMLVTLLSLKYALSVG